MERSVTRGQQANKSDESPDAVIKFKPVAVIPQMRELQLNPLLGSGMSGEKTKGLHIASVAVPGFGEDLAESPVRIVCITDSDEFPVLRGYKVNQS